ncbi:MAG: radical SAM protein [Deltaproteobacteria bacterium]|nr:radical SAM protein [Deltaproteobacteria bacterium]
MFEQGVIRPPSEASSLLVRVTRNCPWNRCLFCPAYKGVAFSKRSVEEVKRDIDEMAVAYDRFSGRITTAFLQDADTLILPTEELVAILEHIKRRFPNIDRITTYARAKSMKRKSVASYRAFKEAGLTRIHTGLESGSLRVLKMIRKGITPEDIVTGGQRVVEAGISLSEYIMPGIGGKTLSEEHALETARLLNQIRPDFIRVRTFAMHPESPMMNMVRDGVFIPMTDDEIVAEIRILLANLDEMPSHFRCGDFSLNLLMHVDGPLDTRKAAMLEELDRFLALSRRERQAYSLLHRSYPGYQRPLEVIRDKDLMKRLEEEIEKMESTGEEAFDAHIRMLMSYQLPQPQTDCWT